MVMQRVKKEEKKILDLSDNSYRPKKHEGKLRYKKISGGVHDHRDGQKVKNGEILYVDKDAQACFGPGSLSEVLLKGFECMDEQIKAATQGIKLGIKAKSAGWYDVVNTVTGDVLNDKSLRAADAKKFITGDLDDEVEEVVADKDTEE